MAQTAISDAKRRIVDLLKAQGPATAAAMAHDLGLTDVAVRQHLQALESHGLVHPRRQPAEGRGRPSQRWELTELAGQLFPDRHGELTVGLLGAMRTTFGEKGLQRVIQARMREQAAAYRAALPSPKKSLKSRVEALARQRTAEGYMAEAAVDRPGSYLLIEHHCPICEAASCCVGLCGAELELFQTALGPDVAVERTAHLLSGDQRCAYRISKR